MTCESTVVMILLHRTTLRLLVCMILCSGIPRATSFVSTRSLYHSFLTLAAVNGEQPSDDSSSKTPRTGWNHNQPSPNSSFWESRRDTAPNTPAAKKPSTLRTGWLHNTKPPIAPSSSSSTSISTGAPQDSSQARQRLELAKMQQIRNHRMLTHHIHAVGTKQPMVVSEHVLSVPLHNNNSSQQQRIDVYFTIVEKLQNEDFWNSLQKISMSPRNRADAYVAQAGLTNASGLLLYLQGGPGFGADIPVAQLGLKPDSSWASSALDHYSRLVLMDQRGTGRSTPITKQSLQLSHPSLFQDSNSTTPWQPAVESVTEYLSHFRADNIVRDAEAIKEALLLPDDRRDKPNPWGCALGQSFGGFCAMTYLSLIPNPPSILLLTGGIAPMLTSIDEVYDRLWDRVAERNLRYYELHPDDVLLVKRIVRHLLHQPQALPSGGILTARRFLQLGLGLGSSPTRFASLHTLLSSAFLTVPGSSDEVVFTRAFLKKIEIEQSFDDHPIYFWLHESIYADGKHNSPTNWAAHRAYERKIQSNSEFDYRQTCQETDERPVLFFGEMVFPWMVEDYAELQGGGLSTVANALASKSDWGPLFDADAMKAALNSKCRAAALVYHEDMYVEFEACMKVAARNGPLGKVKLWVTNEYQHSGLRDDGAKIFAKLHGMATGSIRTPS